MPAIDEHPAWAARAHVSAEALDLLHGALAYRPAGDGWVLPERFTPQQLRALGSCHAWHPGYFRQLAVCTSGITLEFVTDATVVGVEVHLYTPPRGTLSVIEDVERWDDGPEAPYDGVSCVVDGRHLPLALPDGTDLVEFSLDDPAAAPEPGLQHLPGMGDEHHVTVYLPNLTSCAVREVFSDGSFIKAVEAKEQLLVLGDSIAQGYVAKDPDLAWSARLARDLDLDLVNQGVGGQVFQPGTLSGLSQHVSPAAIVVEFGENYRFEPCTASEVRRDVRAYLRELVLEWPDVPTWVITCPRHLEDAYPTHPKSCAGEVDSIIREEAAFFEQVRVVEGARLLDDAPALLADGSDHPGPEGQKMMYERLAYVMGATGEPAAFRRQMAQELLADAPDCALPLKEAVRRGIGEVLLAERDAVLLQVSPTSQMLWAKSGPLGRQAATCLGREGGITCVLGSRAAALAVARVLGGKARSCHLAFYRGEGSLEADPAWTVRTLGPAHAQVIRSHYSHVEYLEPGELESALAAGKVLGCFDEGRLCGFVGEHADGSIGLLEVFEEHRREGWGTALMLAKANQQLAEGLVPWAEVWPENAASVSLMKSIGFEVLPANQMWFVA